VLLVVDANNDTCATLSRLLRAGKREIVTVNSGFKALALLDLYKPALIILEFNLPVLDGLTLLKTIRRLPGRQDLPVVMYADAVDKRQQQLARGLEAHVFPVANPLDLPALVLFIGKYVDPQAPSPKNSWAPRLPTQS
jgi:CheY-like chemotaxis protein